MKIMLFITMISSALFFAKLANATNNLPDDSLLVGADIDVGKTDLDLPDHDEAMLEEFRKAFIEFHNEAHEPSESEDGDEDEYGDGDDTESEDEGDPQVPDEEAEQGE